MSLIKYKAKRRFNETPEPKGKTTKSTTKLIFTIQRHHASHLHYDFRLELEGVLKSWAVPKGPSLNPTDRRLAMMVEDHPKDYADFEGDIPEGNYGAGHVDVWDYGTYEPVDKRGEVISAAQFLKDLKAGSIKFRLKGKKLKGEFALVHMNKGEKTWLLIKHRDEYATDKPYNSEDYAKKSSLAYTAKRVANSKSGKKSPAETKTSIKKSAPIQKLLATKKVSKEKKSLNKKINDKKLLENGELRFGKVKVKVTNPNKVYWPREKYTKGDVINYYQQVADFILPYLKDRPQSLLRNPNGIKDKGFFHKDAGGDEAPSWIKSISIHSESNNKDIDYIICNDKATLAYLNNLGCIELNPWNSTTKALDKPDYMIIDIDPSEKNTFDQVIEVALLIKEILDKADAESYCKTSGASGLHVFVPMGKKYSYEQVKGFCQIICVMAQEQLADFTTLERNLKKRGNKHIYMDYLQNRRGQTISSVYSVRPKPGATVSTPLLWKELKKGLHPLKFTINTIYKRLEKYGDLFEGVLGKGVDINKCLKNLDAG